MTRSGSDLSIVAAWALIFIAACQGLQTGFQVIAIIEAGNAQQKAQEQFRQGLDEIRQAQEAVKSMKVRRPSKSVSQE